MAITLSAPRGLMRLTPALRTLVRAVLAGEGRRPGEIGIVLAGDAELRALNRRWRGIDRAPMCSASAMRTGGARLGRPRDLDGPVHAQARRYRVSRGRELARLTVHGALHLAGLDHQRPAEGRAMRLRENRALAAGAAAVRDLDRVLEPGP
jgi:probable rRNA maturation factor